MNYRCKCGWFARRTGTIYCPTPMTLEYELICRRCGVVRVEKKRVLGFVKIWNQVGLQMEDSQ